MTSKLRTEFSKTQDGSCPRGFRWRMAVDKRTESLGRAIHQYARRYGIDELNVRLEAEQVYIYDSGYSYAIASAPARGGLTGCDLIDMALAAVNHN